MRIIEPKTKRAAKIVLYKCCSNTREIYINKQASSVLNIKAGDYILFGQDDIDESIFYVFKAKKGTGFKVSSQGESQTNLRCASFDFYNLVMGTFKPDGKGVTLELSDKSLNIDGINAYMLIEYKSDDV